ncbi:hypothetical protein QTP86_011206 [Hemibagrus guttatus]|nr:hypothetical protein QTP86_011206 [Hemibagrus guttatus]
MKESVADFRQARSDHSPLNIKGSNVEIVKSTKFLGVHLVEDLTWSLNTSSITKKAQQHLYFLQRLRKAHLPPLILTTFYRGTIESILSSCITAWFGNYTMSEANSIVDDPTHPSHTLFTLLPSGKRASALPGTNNHAAVKISEITFPPILMFYVNINRNFWLISV